jgi:MFS family permease
MLVATGFGAMALVRGYAALTASVVVWTFGEMILVPSSNAYVADISPPARRGVYMGFYTTVFSLAFTIGPWLGATMLERFGPSIMWGGAFALGCASAALLGRLRPRPASL